MAKIIPFKRPVKKKKPPQAAQTSMGLSDAVRELLKSGVDLDQLAAGSSVAEIYEANQRIHLRVAIPNQKKEELKLGLSDNLLRVISTKSGSDKTIQQVPLPFQVQRHSAIARYLEGVLEVEFMKVPRPTTNEEWIPLV